MNRERAAIDLTPLLDLFMLAVIVFSLAASQSAKKQEEKHVAEKQVLEQENRCLQEEKVSLAAEREKTAAELERTARELAQSSADLQRTSEALEARSRELSQKEADLLKTTEELGKRSHQLLKTMEESEKRQKCLAAVLEKLTAMTPAELRKEGEERPVEERVVQLLSVLQNQLQTKDAKLVKHEAALEKQQQKWNKLLVDMQECADMPAAQQKAQWEKILQSLQADAKIILELHYVNLTDRIFSQPMTRLFWRNNGEWSVVNPRRNLDAFIRQKSLAAEMPVEIRISRGVSCSQEEQANLDGYLQNIRNLLTGPDRECEVVVSQKKIHEILVTGDGEIFLDGVRRSESEIHDQLARIPEEDKLLNYAPSSVSFYLFAPVNQESVRQNLVKEIQTVFQEYPHSQPVCLYYEE